MQNLRTFPELHTPRLTLRQIVPGDIGQIYAGLSDPAVTRYYAVSYDSLEATGAQMEFYDSIWQARTGMWWGICLSDSPVLIGTVGFNGYQPAHRRTESGYWLLPAYWGKGLATEALTEVLRFGFSQLGLHRIEALVEGGNTASGRILEKTGFRYEGTMRECEIKNDRFIDLLCYSRLSTDPV